METNLRPNGAGLRRSPIMVSLSNDGVAPISNNPLMEIVLAATSSSLRQKSRATNNSSRRTYTKFSREDVEELILAVEQNGTRWTSIARLPRFKEQGRTNVLLMEKWRHMTTGADDKKDPEMRDKKKK